MHACMEWHVRPKREDSRNPTCFSLPPCAARRWMSQSEMRSSSSGRDHSMCRRSSVSCSVTEVRPLVYAATCTQPHAPS